MKTKEILQRLKELDYVWKKYDTGIYCWHKDEKGGMNSIWLSIPKEHLSHYVNLPDNLVVNYNFLFFEKQGKQALLALYRAIVKQKLGL
jgi:hypothetical protein